MVRENGTSERTCIIYKCMRIGRKKNLRNGLRIFDFILFKYLDNVYYSQPWIVVIDDSIAIRAEIPWMPKKIIHMCTGSKADNASYMDDNYADYAHIYMCIVGNQLSIVGFEGPVSAFIKGLKGP